MGIGNNSKTSKFKKLVNLAMSRIVFLKKQHLARFSYAISDVSELLRIDHQQKALLRVEQVIKEKNIMDVLVLIEDYCQLIVNGIGLLQRNKECPEELKEAVLSLIFASSRYGAIPELQDIRSIFTSYFGKDFADQAVELPNNCSVNPKLIQKLSSRQPSSETRMKVFMNIASENDVTLNLEYLTPMAPKVKVYVSENKLTEASRSVPLKELDHEDNTQEAREVNVT